MSSDATTREQPQPVSGSQWMTQRDVTPLVVTDIRNLGWRPVPTDVVRKAYFSLLDVGIHMAGSAEQLANDVEARSTLGAQRYGTPLRTFNGRDAEVDMYQEILDALQYGRQALEERDERRRISER